MWGWGCDVIFLVCVCVCDCVCGCMGIVLAMNGEAMENRNMSSDSAFN